MWSDMINIGSQKGIVKLLVGNKCDLTSQKIVEYDTAKVRLETKLVKFKTKEKLLENKRELKLKPCNRFSCQRESWGRMWRFLSN